MIHTERFAPSPTGPLHLGHAFSAFTAFEAAKTSQGRFLLRIEDIDSTRSRPEWEAQIYRDLKWLGIAWESPVWRQSEHMSSYDEALKTLWDQGLIYPCTCSRRDIKEAANAPQEGQPALGPDGLIYPGTCRQKPRPLEMPQECALRLDMARAAKLLGQETITYKELDPQISAIQMPTKNLPNAIGDVVLARPDSGTSYHLSVVLDDAAQMITHVTRGADLAEATTIHVVLQKLLSLPTPIYRHHRLIRDEDGKRLAKRDDARAISTYRDAGATPEDIKEMIGLS